MDTAQILKRQNLRGLAKCKVCGHYNGIRATACKNKQCSLSKVGTKPKLKPNINAIQLNTNDELQLFSVQIRDRDIDNRNFVSITEKIISSDANASIINRNAICYVDTCKYDSNDINISCKHVKSSLESCTTKAKIEKVDENILKRLEMSNETRRKLMKMHKESQSATPLVQRINQRVFVVCCDVSLNFPIGLLHIVCIVEENGVRFCCACQKLKVLISSNQRTLHEKDICEHILLILCAIMSDLNLQNEFRNFTTIVKQFLSNTTDDCQWLNVESLDNIELIQIPEYSSLPDSETMNSSYFNVEQCNGKNLQSIDMKNVPIPVENKNIPMDKQLNCTEYSDGLGLVGDQIEFIGETQNNLSVDSIYGLDVGSYTTNDVVLSYLCSEDMLFEDLPMEIMEENDMSNKECLKQSENESFTEYELMCRNLNNVQLESYLNWLDSVIEATNLSMDFNNDGFPEPLKFSVPHLYFDILRTKFSAGTKKKRLPNQTTVLTNGKYKKLTMFTWIFSNIKLIKHILSTKTMELEVVRSFRKISQNEFEYISPCDMNHSDDEDGHNRKIRPTTYKTYLKTKGFENNCLKKTNKHGLFLIEWIPNTLPISKFGEMRITLQYGHMKNNTVLH